MLDGHLLVDAHVHVPVLGSLKPAWVQWAQGLRPGRHPRPGLGLRRPDRPGGAGRALRRAGRRRGPALLRVQPQGHRHPAVRGPAADRRAQPVTVPAGRQRQPAPALPDRRRARPAARPGRGGAQAAPGPRRLPLRRPGAVAGVRRPGRARRPADRALRDVVVPRLDERARPPRAPAAGRPRLPRRSTWCSPTAAAAGGTTRPRSWRSSTRPCGSSCRACRPSGCRSTTRGTTSTGWRGSGSSPPTGRASDTATNARAVAGLGLDDDVVAGVLGRNALRVYAGLDHLA